MNVKSELKWILLIALVGFGIYANSLGGEFVYDDSRQIVRNPLIQNISLAGTALTSDVWAFKGDGNLTASNYWRPTFTAWCILNFQAFGLNPFAWHLTNVLLHLGVLMMAFLLLRRWGMPTPAALGIIAVFSAHPVHVESVAWVSGSTDLLFALSFLASLWFAENRRSGGGNLDLGLALLFYALALGSKEVALVCLPIYFVIFARTDDGRWRKPIDPGSKTARNAFLAFAALGIAYFVARWAVLGKITHPVENAVGAANAILSVPSVFLFYWRQILLPISLSVNYPNRAIDGFGVVAVLLPAVLSAGIVIGLWFLARRSFLTMLGAAMFLLPLAPALFIASFPADQIVHDRYLYLPLLGFLIIVFAELGPVVARFTERPVLAALAVLLAIPLAAQTVLYNRVWSSNLTLWENAVRVDPSSSSNFVQYGVALSGAGRVNEALDAFNSALDIEPNPYAYLGRAQAFIANEQFEEAVWDLQTLTEMKSDKVNVYTLYQSYEALAVALQKKNDLVRAERLLLEARKRLPIYSAALTEKLAVILYLKNEKPRALAELEAARDRARSEMLSSSKTVFFRLGMLYAEKGDRQNARLAFQEYLKLTANISERQVLADRKTAAEMLKNLN